MSRKRPSQNNSIFDATKGLSIGKSLGDIKVHWTIERQIKEELIIFQRKFPAFQFYWTSTWQGFHSFQCYCYSTSGNKNGFDFTRICMIVPENSEDCSTSPLLYTYDHDRSLNASAVGRGYEEPWTEGINSRIRPQVVDQEGLQIACDAWYSRNSDFGKAMIDLRNVNHNLTWEPYNHYGVYQMFLDEVPIWAVPKNQDINYNTIKGMILEQIQNR